MAQFSVKPNSAQTTADAETRLTRELIGLENDIRTISNQLAFEVAAKANIRGRLGSAAGNVSRHQSGMQNMSVALRDIINDYNRTENAILGNLNVGGAGSGAGNHSDSGAGYPSDGNHGGGAGYPSDGNHGGGAGRPFDENARKPPFPMEGEISAFAGSASAAESFLGVDASGSLSGDLFGASYEITPGSAEAEIHIAHGSAEGDWGMLHGEGDVYIGQVKAGVETEFQLFDGGEFRPAFQLSGEIGAAAVAGEVMASIGSETTNVHLGAEGSLASAEANASLGIGRIEYKDENGVEHTSFGVQAEAGAVASLASGEVSGGLTIFGITIDASISGHAGAVGASIGGHVTTDGAGFSLGGALGLGGGIDVKIDWSKVKFGWWKD